MHHLATWNKFAVELIPNYSRFYTPNTIFLFNRHNQQLITGIKWGWNIQTTIAQNFVTDLQSAASRIFDINKIGTTAFQN